MLLLSGGPNLAAQEHVADSLSASEQSNIGVPRDSLRQPAKSDTLKQKQKKNEIEGPIHYDAEDIRLSDGGNVIHLRGSAKLKYQKMTLTAERIKIDRQKNTLYARGVVDSIGADSMIYYAGTPVFEEEGEEPLYGNFIEYNFSTKRGKIRGGKTEMEPGYYRGEKIHRIADSTLLVRDGIFTSCEYIDDPHFYFKSSKIRLKMKDKVVARPIVFYIADVPLGWLPFGIFPNKRGRHSGIVVPSYGENKFGGRFLRGMGYYWAPNDYFDATLLADFYDKLGFTYRADVRYTIRYKLNGSISGEYLPRDPYSGQKRERWRLRFKHNHNIDPTLSISGSGYFTSDKTFSQQLSPNVDDRLNQQLNSNLSMRKNWKGTKNSMQLSASRNENLQTGRIDYTLPNFTFNRSQSTIYETITGERLGSKRSWYQKIYFSYNTNLIHRGSKVPTGDSLDAFEESTREGMQHRLSFSAPQKVFKYFSINPSLSVNEDWVNEVTVAEVDTQTNKLITRQQTQFAARHTFRSSLGVNTTLYGLFEPNIGDLKFIRHKLDPSLTFSYTPDFSSPFYGYYDTVSDTLGREIKYDRFGNTPFGGTGRNKSRAMSVRLGNVFQGKLINNEGEEKKLDLFTVNFSTNYNFERDSLKWSNISTNLRTRLFGKNINFNFLHSFYKPKQTGSGSINEFQTLPRLLSLTTSFGFSLDNKTFAKKDTPEQKDTETETEEEISDNEGILENAYIENQSRDEMKDTKNIAIPWRTSFNLNYRLNRFNVNDPVEQIDLSASAQIQLTKNWKISWNAHFDLVAKEITTQSFNIYRDLHCWEMSFSWQPIYDYYSFQINVKASALQDIKVTKHPTRSRFVPRY